MDEREASSPRAETTGKRKRRDDAEARRKREVEDEASIVELLRLFLLSFEERGGKRVSGSEERVCLECDRKGGEGKGRRGV